MMMLTACAIGLLLAGEPAKPELRELQPGVRVAEGVVEFDGTVCADLSHPQTPVVYLELLITGPDSREHESLVVTTVKPSSIHAGLLAAGFEPGHPVRRTDNGATAPEGDALRVEVAVVGDDGPGPFVDLASWAVNKEDKTRLPDAEGWGLVFAGSVLDARGYGADKAGTIVGLTGFGTEVVAASWTLSHLAAVDAPVWVVDGDRVPAFGTEVVVRISAPEEDPDSSQEAGDFRPESEGGYSVGNGRDADGS